MAAILVEDRPFDDDDPMAALLGWQDGVITRRQALRFVSAKVIERRLTTHRWRALWKGVYLTHPGSATEGQRRWVAVLSAGGDSPGGTQSPACIGGLTALCIAGLRSIKPAAIDVLVPTARRRSAPRGVVIRRTVAMPDHGSTRVLVPPATLPARSVVDAAAWARSEDEARLIVAASFQQRLVTLRGVTRALEAAPLSKRAMLVRQTALDCDAGSHSLAELDLVGLCRRFHLPIPSRQVRVADADGRVRFLDALFEEWMVAIEIDGAHHLDVRQLWDDQQRQNALELQGYVVLRFPAYMVRQHPERVAADIRAALVRAGWRP